MDLDERIRTLERSTVFANIPREDLTLLASVMRVERFSANETVCNHGEPANDVFVVATGELDVFLQASKSAVRTLVSGDVFGEYAMLAGFTRTSTVVSRTNATLLSLDYARFREFLVQFPESTLVLLESAVGRLLHLENQRP